MLTYKNRNKKISFIGDILILIVVAIFIYLIHSSLVSSQIDEVSQIQTTYLISTQDLIPENTTSYIEELQSLDSKYTKPIIEFTKLYNLSKEVSKKIELNRIQNNCIKNQRLNELNIIKNKKDNVLDGFRELESSKLNKIYWKDYIDILENYNIKSKKIQLEKNLC